MSKNHNVFLARKNAPVKKITKRDDVELTIYYMRDHVKEVDPEDDGNFIIEKRPAIYSREKLNAKIQSYASDVDLKQMIGRINSKEEFAELVARTGLPQSGEIIDQRPFENLTELEAEALIKRGESAWLSLPDDLKGDLSKEEFLKNFNAQMLIDYANKLAAQKTEVKKEGE